MSGTRNEEVRERQTVVLIEGHPYNYLEMSGTHNEEVRAGQTVVFY